MEVFLSSYVKYELGGATGYAIHPVRDLGPRIAHALLSIAGKESSDWAYSLVPIVGPFVGGRYGALFYRVAIHQQFTIIFWIGTDVVAVLIIGAVILEVNDQNLVQESKENKAV